MKVKKVAVTAALVAAASVLGYAAAPVSQATAPPSSNGPSPSVAAPKLLSTGPAATEDSFVAVHACRAVNTAKKGGRIHPNATRSFHIVGSTGFAAQGGTAGGCGVPASATAVSIRVGASGSSKAGGFAVFPTGSPTGLATFYYAKSAKVMTGATVQLAAGGGKSLTVKQLGGDAQLTIDVAGYYAPPLNAFVQTDGSLTYTSGRATGSTHPSTGNYVVTFDRDVSQCSYAVTPYAFNYPVAVGPQGADANSVHIYIHEQIGSVTPHDTSFYLLVTC